MELSLEVFTTCINLCREYMSFRTELPQKVLLNLM